MDASQLTPTLRCSKKLWYAVFTSSEQNPWYFNIFLWNTPKEFHHIFMMTPVTGSHMLVVDPTGECLHIELREFEGGWTSEILRLAKDNPVVEFPSDPKSCRTISNCLPSCVSVAKALLGLKSNAITPYQLYQSLLKAGGEVVR